VIVLKVVAKPIEVVAWFDNKIGTVHPVRFRIMQNEAVTTVIIDKIIKQIEERLAGNYTLVFTCQSLINDTEKIYEIKYEIATHRWVLFKI
jgi:hypothetical protein